MTQLESIRRPIEAELARYRELFAEALSHDDDFLGRALDYVRRKQGKMMRPILVLLIAREFGEVSEQTLRAAVALELLHTASLVHDDVVDESDERRGVPSLNTVFGNKVAVLLGDYLLSVCLGQAAQTGDPEVVNTIAQLGGTLSAGEMLQLSNIREEEVSEEAYFRVIRSKTAALFATCGQLGALSAGAPAEMVARARELGELIGICFQIRDDIFDYSADSAAIGKPTGSDLAEGKITLPAIYALRHADTETARALAAKIKAGTASSDDLQRVVELAKTSGGIDYAKNIMEQYRAKAEVLLAAFVRQDVRTALDEYLGFVVKRSI